jgi:hypothetical protein
MAGYKANNNPKTQHAQKMYNGYPVRMTILYSGKTKTKCGVWRGQDGEPNLIVDSNNKPVPYNQIGLNTQEPIEAE